MNSNEMLSLAESLMKPEKLNARAKICDTVCVLISDSDTLYTGVSLVATCGLGYCSEQAAITQMINKGEHRIKKLLVLDKFGNLFPPCGKCLELITQIDETNKDAIVILKDEEKTIHELYPYDWKRIKNKV